MIVYVDDEPKTSIPFLAEDYSSCLLCSCLYEPLFIKKSLNFEENLVIDETVDKEIKFTFKDFYWSDGQKVKPVELKNTLLYIIKNKLPKSHYLDFIVGVKEYLDGDTTSLTNIKISSDDNSIYMTSLLDGDQYKYVFSTIYFSPIRFEKYEPNMLLSYGPFQLNQVKDLTSLDYNPYYHNPIKEPLEIVKNKNPKENIEHFFDGKCDLTSTTVFRSSDINFFSKSLFFRKKESNLILQLELSEGFLKYKNNILEKLNNFINNSCDLKNDIKLKLEYQKSPAILEEIKDCSILYSDYYPNNNIAQYIIDILKYESVEVQISLGDLDYFINQYSNSTNYDIYINVFSPVTQSDLDRFISHINYIREDKLDNYLLLLNQWIQGDIEKYNIDRLISHYSRRLTIGNINHYYFQSSKLNGFFIDGNDNFIFKYVEVL
ncbi:hypothetical protein [Bacillus sp. NPDC093026]|uniref:hypothetical protein n=1 Tax=Bacillus sp. NPDC093026 TaxID=3363948 RepID=UPI0037FDBEB8